jgi:hypothetical protein
MTGQELVGALFTTPKNLRHLAEQEFGQLFVPTELLMEGARHAMLALTVDRIGRVVVHAERPRKRNPFVVTRVDLPRTAQTHALAGCGEAATQRLSASPRG